MVAHVMITHLGPCIVAHKTPALGKYKPPKIQILLTKCDLVARLDLARKVTVVRQQLDEVNTSWSMMHYSTSSPIG